MSLETRVTILEKQADLREFVQDAIRNLPEDTIQFTPEGKNRRLRADLMLLPKIAASVLGFPVNTVSFRPREVDSQVTDDLLNIVTIAPYTMGTLKKVVVPPGATHIKIQGSLPPMIHFNYHGTNYRIKYK